MPTRKANPRIGIPGVDLRPLAADLLPTRYLPHSKELTYASRALPNTEVNDVEVRAPFDAANLAVKRGLRDENR